MGRSYFNQFRRTYDRKHRLNSFFDSSVRSKQTVDALHTIERVFYTSSHPHQSIRGSPTVLSSTFSY